MNSRSLMFQLWVVVLTLALITSPLPLFAKTKKSTNSKSETYQAYSSLSAKNEKFRVFLKSNKDKIEEKDFKYIERRTKDVQDEKLGMSYRNDQIHFTDRKKIVTFEVIDGEKNKFKVNGKKVELPDTESPEEIWKRIQAVMPQDKSSSFFDLILPRAHAQGIGIAEVAIGSLVVGGIYLTVKAIQNLGCGNWRETLKKCEDAKKLLTEKRKDGNYEHNAATFADTEDFASSLYMTVGSVYKQEAVSPDKNCGTKRADAQACRSQMENLILGRFSDGQSEVDTLAADNELQTLYTAPGSSSSGSSSGTGD